MVNTHQRHTKVREGLTLRSSQNSTELTYSSATFWN